MPSGGVGETRILEIKTWYETEDTYDGGQVYISKNSGSTWQLITPIGGYDGTFTESVVQQELLWEISLV